MCKSEVKCQFFFGLTVILMSAGGEDSLSEFERENLFYFQELSKMIQEEGPEMILAPITKNNHIYDIFRSLIQKEARGGLKVPRVENNKSEEQVNVVSAEEMDVGADVDPLNNRLILPESLANVEINLDLFGHFSELEGEPLELYKQEIPRHETMRRNNYHGNYSRSDFYV